MKVLLVLITLLSLNSFALNDCESYVLDVVSSVVEHHGDSTDYDYSIKYLGDGFFDVVGKFQTKVVEYEVAVDAKCDISSIVKISD